MVRFVCLGLLAIAMTGCGPSFDLKSHNEVNVPLNFASIKQVNNGDVIPGSYIVAFKAADSSRLFMKDYRREYQAHYMALSNLEMFEDGVTNLHYMTSLDLSNKTKSEKESKLDMPRQTELYFEAPVEAKRASLFRVDFEDESTAQTLLTKWMEDGLIFYADPNYQSRPFEGEQNFADYAETYEKLENVPWIDQIGLVDALQELSNKGVTFDNPPLIAVMDSGTDYEHPSLVSNIWTNPSPGAAGCSDDIHGCDATKSFKGSLGTGSIYPALLNGAGLSCDSQDSKGKGVCMHGTHVAGIIASEPSDGAQNGYGGMCPVCRLVTVKVIGKNKLGEGKATTIADSSIIAGLTYISRFKISNSNAVRIVNASFGKFLRSRSVEHLVRLLKEQGSGTLIIAAAGNEDTMKRTYPAAFKDTLAVVNTTSSSDLPSKAPSSNYGIWTDIAGPGEGGCIGGGDGNGLLSTVPGGGVFCLHGTSMASPVVAGVAGLLLASEPNLSVDDIVSRLTSTADPIIYSLPENSLYYPRIEGEPNPIPLLGSGIVNAANAIKDVSPNRRPRPAFERVNSSCGTIYYTDTYLSKWFWLSFLFFPLVIPYFMVVARSGFKKTRF